MTTPPAHETVANSSSENWTVQKILDWTTGHLRKQGIESARLESEILLAHARKCERIQLYTHFNEVVSDDVRARMRDLVKRRVRHEPVAYLVGRKEFFSLEFHVEPGVFIPRPETETLVMEGLDALRGISEPSILELCTGSGCIPVALASRRRDARITTVERHEVPLKVARTNIEKHEMQGQIELLAGSLFQPLPANRKFHLLVSNPPYVRHDEIPGLADDVAQHEPHEALDGGDDGLDLVRVILKDAPPFLHEGAICLLEMDPSQMNSARKYAASLGYWDKIRAIDDLADQPRFLSARYSP